MRFYVPAAILTLVGAAIAQPAPPVPPNPMERVTDQIALELGRLRIENATLAVSLEVLRARIKELEGRDCR